MTSIFFSYSHRDETWRNELEIHLQALQRQGLIDTWHDRCLLPGDDVDRGISEYLESASIILLLVSPYFIASDYCYDVEMTRALQRHEAGEARVIPVILEPCVWQDLPFGKLLATPTDGKPVSKHPNPHDAFVDIVKALRRALPDKETQQRQPEPASMSRTAVELPRSSNLRIRKEFTDEDRHQFLEESFEYLARFFEGSVAEVEKRNDDVTGRFRRVSADRFTAVLYRHGKEITSGTVWLGTDTGLGHGINFCYGVKSDSNSYNESFSIEDYGYALFLKGFGFAGTDKPLSQHGAAEYLWRLVIERLQ